MRTFKRACHSGRGAVAMTVAVLLVLLTGCTGPAQPQLPGPIAVVAQLKQVKLLSFEWTGGQGATSFRVSRLLTTPMVVADGISGSATGYDLELFLPDQVGAEYRVEACNAAGCVSSQSVEVDREDLDLAVGYVKPPSPGGDDRFGEAVAISVDGQVLAIGAPREDGGGSGVNPPVGESLANSGAVYVYTRVADGQWSGPVYIKAPVPGVNDRFGSTVVLSADGAVLAVGAVGEAGGGSGVDPPHDDLASSSGAVYLYEMSEAGVWKESTYFKAGQVTPDDGFGSALALSGDGRVLAVGVRNDDGDGANIGSDPNDLGSATGAVWVYELSATGLWLPPTYIKARHPDDGDYFGFAVALSSDGAVLAVGGTGEDGSGEGTNASEDNLSADSGAVWVYDRDEAGQWQLDAYLKAGNTGPDDLLGRSVALSADGVLLAVGAPGEDGSGTNVGAPYDDLAGNTGAVYVYARDTSGDWLDPHYLKPGAAAPAAAFGYSLAWSGDGTRLAVGAVEDSLGGTGIEPPTAAPSPASGSVWLYESLPGGEWSEARLIKASNTGSGDVFGAAVALPAGPTVLVVGAPLEDGGQAGIGGDQNDNSMSSAGAVYLY